MSPHQCVHCGEIYPAGSKELLTGCSSCKSHFFFYIKDEHLAKIRENPLEIPQAEKKTIEKDLREMAGITDVNIPVILDIESVRAMGSGKFEIDLVNLFKKGRPLVYKLEEGKYIIDLATTLNQSIKNLNQIKDPSEYKKEKKDMAEEIEEEEPEEEIDLVEEEIEVDLDEKDNSNPEED